MADKLSMVPSPSWRDHFKIDENILKSFWGDFSQSSPIRASELTQSGAAQSIEFVLWCIREGHFSEEAFLHHQSKTYEIPIVSAAFFDSPVDRDFWNRVKDAHPWTSECVPLTEWDGFLLIASVWPQRSIKASLRHRLVFATPTQLREFYGRLQRPSAAPTAAPISPPISLPKESQEPDNGDPFAALSRSMGLPTDGDETPEGDLLSHEGDASDEAPEGLVIPEGLSFSSDELSRLNEQDDGPAAPAKDLTPIPEPLAKRPPPPTATPAPEPAPAKVPAPAPAPVLVRAPETAPDAAAVRPSPPKPTTKAPPPPPPPVMPFSPVVTPDAPAMVKPVSPKVQPPPPPVAVPTAPSSAPAASAAATSNAPSRPPAEATVVVSADAVGADPSPDAPSSKVPDTAPMTSSIESPKTRRPLFEPSSGEKPTPTATIPKAVSGGAASATASGTQTATGTAARNRRLEATPLTSFFSPGSMAPNPVNAKSAIRSAPSNSKYSGHVISINKIEPMHLDQCTNVDEAGAQALLQTCNTFETGMILLFKDGVLQPWKWTDLMLSVKGDKPDDIDLREPSIFKVVFRTAKPYHGYVVTSTVNQKFFNEFYRGLMPKHATVIPIMIDGRMGGMILGLTNSKIDYRQSLRLMERLGFDIARVFKMLRGALAKAS